MGASAAVAGLGFWLRSEALLFSSSKDVAARASGPPTSCCDTQPPGQRDRGDAGDRGPDRFVGCRQVQFLAVAYAEQRVVDRMSKREAMQLLRRLSSLCMCVQLLPAACTRVFGRVLKALAGWVAVCQHIGEQCVLS